MKTLLRSLALILFPAASAFAGLLSGPIYNFANGHTYYLLTTSPWTTSEAEAISLGGHLVTVNNAAENNFLLSTFSNYGGVERALWTGLNDAAVEGTFVWSSGEIAAYRNWEAGQPDNGSGFYPSENYVLVWPSPGPRSPGFWNDYIDSNTFPDMNLNVFGVVEVVPEPSIMGLFTCGLVVGIPISQRCRKSVRG